ncbi:MT-A70 family methyltransferase [Bradyrhizobium sp. BR 10261]|uniref:MT-A70 family methyltransferase n=1 Tax=Bradyrhizobium sp. BR 10261 TaxID=2749992 RepID=UPI001C6476F5|nr:MT-A70 family methyltransferase [Bradyrhizobium sp. BR 10261]MBW7966781.1 hypothetical protein [Bradyrhizobium sp. BR 10261]
MTELVRYEAARRALAEAVAVDEVAEIRSKADAMRHYARQAGDKALEIQAAQIRFRAERRLGELLVAAKKAGQIRAGNPNRSQSEQLDGGALERAEADLEAFKDQPLRVTLQEAGIDRKLSMRAQQIAAMDAAEFEQALEKHADEMRAGTGRVAMDLHRVVSELKGRIHRNSLARELSDRSALLSPSGRKYPVIYADPAWRRHQGVTDRSYENHYPTMTWDEICALPVAEMVLPDAWLFLWIPRAHAFALHEIETEVTSLPDGEVIRARVEMPLGYAVAKSWGFDAYSTCAVWTKTDAEHPDVAGTGKIFRDQDELLLLFKRGQGLPMPEKKFGSNHRERPREHSRKPDFYRDMIASMAGGLPVLELFARVDAEHPLPEGWGAWGNQAGAEPEVAPEGEAEAAAAEATENGASAAAAVEPDRAPYDAGDVVTIDQLAGADWLEPGLACDAPALEAAPFDPASIGEREALKILSDFCHLRRDIAPALGEFYLARGFTYRGAVEWSLTGRGWDRLRELEAAELPAKPRVELTAPRAQADTLFDFARQIDQAPAPEVVDGALQTRLPVDDDELAEQLALLAIDAGEAIEPQMLRHLVGKGFAHCGITKTTVTDDGRALLGAAGSAGIRSTAGG